MKVVGILFFLLFSFALSYPNLPLTFNAKVNLILASHTGNGNDTGSGLWAVDVAAKSSIENYVYSKGYFDSLSLNRYDLGKMYRVYGSDPSRCDQIPTEGEMPNVWTWVSMTQLDGHQTYQGKQVDVWSFDVGYGTKRIAVYSTNTSIPAWMDFRGGERDLFIEFTTFTASAPQVSVFSLPSVCQKVINTPRVNSSEACISSATVMSRAEVWVEKHVPYNQDATYDGYREDCSGYVSYCWASSEPGHTTFTMHEIAHPITKAELVPGDCMLYASEHVCLFGGWTDAAKTTYWALEETQPCSTNPKWCGTLKNSIAYPYYYDPSDFLPYRYNSFCG